MMHLHDFSNLLAHCKMPLSNRIYSFPELDFNTFKGLPGLIADSLPDDFGNAVLNAWVAGQGRSPSDITPLQRLQYTGKRGMGALEYAPATQLRSLNASQQVEITQDQLRRLFFKYQVGKSPDYGVVKNGNDYLVTFHSYSDDKAACEKTYTTIQ